MAVGIINNNHSAIFTLRILERNNRSLSGTLEKLSSGMRINRAADDAAGLCISEKMRAQLNGVDQARRNAEDAISMIQTAEGVLDTAHSIVHRMRKLAVQAATDNYTTYDRKQIQEEIDELVDELDRVAQYTEFNTKKLLDGSATGVSNTDRKQVATAKVVGIVANADYSITVIDAGIASSVRGNINLTDVDVTDGGDTDVVANLRDLGIFGSQELHILVDNNTRVISLHESDSLEDVKRKINQANCGVIAGLDAAGNDITMTSIHSGSRFNISFGNDPDGVAVKLGLVGGASQDSSTLSRVTSENLPQFVSGTDTVIEVRNITNQSLFPSDPSYSTNVSGAHLGFFRSNSRFFTETEFSNPLNDEWVNYNAALAGGAGTAGVGASPDLTSSKMLKGLNLHIDEDITYGILTQGDGNGNVQDIGYTAGYDASNGRQGTGNLQDATLERNNAMQENGAGQFFSSPEPSIPGNRVVQPYQVVGGAIISGPAADDSILENWARDGAGTFAYNSVTTCRISVRDTRQVYHIGANQSQTLTAEFMNVESDALGLCVRHNSGGNSNDGVSEKMNGLKNYDLRQTVSVETQESAERAITTINSALKTISATRTRLGALQNSLEATFDYLQLSYELEPESKIRDSNLASEMANFTKFNIMQQAGTAMLAQANSKPQNILRLLG